ncbi:oxidoreductase [Streptomyces cinnamoneus]|uniref:Oxidoreductase n=1 Tax=Streptomyces cinnamoneus TaxID=53446 RepID=A0A2G1XKH7_STRCJ|nr:zinc-binding dehydrogenase [Streptomyces cinnamoneus]PHQ51649.1 oxidoreductase [Streptomyces cinnamoneus]PPT14427.1 oxidoreductase [Streptomyces cinnamoneus]
MRAVRLHAFGPAENLAYEETATPVPGPGQVRVTVAAAGVHLVDAAQRRGDPNGPYGLPELPVVPGREVAGTVDALGEGTDPRWLGRRVVAHLGRLSTGGGYAELAVVDAARLHEIPDGLDEAQAIAMIGTGRTALGILGFTELTGDDVVVVTAAAGGIGSLLVQYAKNAGATVVGLAGGPAKVRHVRDLGADLALDYTDPDWVRAARTALAGRAATVVFDGVGGDAARDAVGLLGRGGLHLVFGWSSQGVTGEGPGAPDPRELAEHGITSRGVLGPAMLERFGGGDVGLRRLEEESLARAAEGAVVPAVQRFPLAAAAEAHRALETRGTVGKVVLVP